MKISVFFIALLIGYTAKCQNQDSVLVNISKLESGNSSLIYDMSIRNNSSEPICVLHAVFIDLNSLAPQAIVAYSENKTEQYFGLSYSAQDTSMILERTLYDGEILMPKQRINFNLSIPRSGKTKSLYLEFIGLPDFCYVKLKEEMKRTATWYSKYITSKIVVKLPD